MVLAPQVNADFAAATLTVDDSSDPLVTGLDRLADDRVTRVTPGGRAARLVAPLNLTRISPRTDESVWRRNRATAHPPR
jgi:hypothetical protein